MVPNVGAKTSTNLQLLLFSAREVTVLFLSLAAEVCYGQLGRSEVLLSSGRSDGLCLRALRSSQTLGK